MLPSRLVQYCLLPMGILIAPSLFAGVFISVNIAPPPLPVCAQPVCPGEGYIWTPGYWAYGAVGYYWVPGVWVLRPAPRLLWTPGYWGWRSGVYVWNAGYLGPHVGFYGGVNYGFGYAGVGYLGGVWVGSAFRYNTAVTNVNVATVHNTYIDRIVINNTTVVNNRASFNGPGGVTARATPAKMAAARDRHIEATPMQVNHERMASTNRANFASVNHANPSLAARARPVSGAAMAGRTRTTRSSRCTMLRRGIRRRRSEGAKSGSTEGEIVPSISPSAVFVLISACCAGATAAPVAPFESVDPLAPRSRIDELVFARWKQLGLQPAHLCSDSVFVRRAWLDVTGTLPTAQQSAAFLASKDPNKRSVLIDQLLDREEFADYWAMKWSDLLRVKAEFPIELWPNAAQSYYHWIRASLRENKPYDQFVRAMLTESGSNFRVPPVNFYRAIEDRDPRGIARTVALTFMGTRAEKWPAERLAHMAAFFSGVAYKHTAEWKEEIVFFDPGRVPAVAPVFPDGTPARLRPGQDPRAAFADWLVAPGNPWFARNIVNRIWVWLLGRGIVQEPDDIRPDNPPENPELLAFLESELAAAHYDLKHIFRLVLDSTAYQISSIPQAPPAQAAAHFAVYPLRRLDAEVLIDALCQITGTSETYTSAVPEPYTFMPDFQRAVSLPDGSIGSSTLELFGRPARDTGLESERNNRLTAQQRLFLLNSSQVQRKIQQGPGLLAAARDIKNPRERVNAIYLTVLSRYPTEDEWKLVQAHFKSQAMPNIDLIWALINSSEFLYRH